MSENKDNFSKIIEDKLNNYEVPYNESHWSEMGQKLDGFKPISGSGSKSLKKYYWAAAAAGIIAVGAWYFIDQNKPTQINLSSEITPNSIENPTISSKATLSQNIDDDLVANESQPITEEEVESKRKYKEADDKLEHYGEHTEDKIKSNSQIYVADKINEQTIDHAGEPVINYDLKTVILLEKETFCVGENVQFNIDTEIENAKYYWDFGDKGLTSRKPHPKHKFKKPGTYDVILYVAKGEIGDKNDYPAKKTIVIKANPEVELDIISKEITLNDPYAEFEAITGCSCEFKWEFNAMNESNGKEVFFLVPDKGSFPIKLISTNEIGCSTTLDEYYYASKGVIIAVETALTPDGDNMNDVFIPQELKISDVEFTFIVTNRTGNVVFQTNDKYDAWNGKLNNSGNQEPDGTYVWKLSFTDDRGKVHYQNGKITLMR